METIVLMLVRNEEQNIEKVLNSIICQEENPQVLIVDDASTDRTVEIALNTLEQSHLDFKIIFNVKNQGVAKNAAHAFKTIQDRNCLMLRVDGDDELPEGALSSLLQAYEPNHFITGSYIEKTGKIEKKIVPPTIYSALACGVLMHTEDVKKAGGLARENVGVFHEYDLYARLINCGYVPKIIDKPVYSYYRHHGSITTDKTAVVDSLEKLKTLWGEKLVSQIRDY